MSSATRKPGLRSRFLLGAPGLRSCAFGNVDGRAPGSASCECGCRRLSSQRGQATVEAAFALPVLMVLVLLLLQPGIVLYDRIVMNSAAAEGCRLLATTTSSNSGTNEDYVRRRLSAVPQIDQFHVHSSGCTWNIELSGDEGCDEVGVKISTEVKPLPLLDFGMALAGLTNASGNLLVEVEATGQVQPDWVSGATEGRNPSAWPGI